MAGVAKCLASPSRLSLEVAADVVLTLQVCLRSAHLLINSVDQCLQYCTSWLTQVDKAVAAVAVVPSGSHILLLQHMLNFAQL